MYFLEIKFIVDFLHFIQLGCNDIEVYQLGKAAYSRKQHLVLCSGSLPLMISIFDNLVDVVLIYIKHIYSAAVLLQIE
jgi:hypothetical protein